MTNTNINLTVSQILKTKSEFEDEPKKISREDWRKTKELDEARKAGTAPATVDEEGKDIKPHILQYIATAPWYYGTAGPTLTHQRPQDDKESKYSNLSEWYKRGVDASKIIRKYRKGAWKNCNALTHKKKDCMQRPGEVGAKFSGNSIAPSNKYIQAKLNLSDCGKHNRWI